MRGTRTLIHAMILPAVLVTAGPVAKAEEHRAEIMARVIDRCYPATVRWRLLEARRKGYADFSEADKDALFSGTARRAYRLPPVGP